VEKVTRKVLLKTLCVVEHLKMNSLGQKNQFHTDHLKELLQENLISAFWRED